MENTDVSNIHYCTAPKTIDLFRHAFYIEANTSDRQLFAKKVREAILQKYNYILIVGEKERADGTVTVKERRSNKQMGVFTIRQVYEMFVQATKEFAL